jgi:hypothetical protein
VTLSKAKYDYRKSVGVPLSRSYMQSASNHYISVEVTDTNGNFGTGGISVIINTGSCGPESPPECGESLWELPDPRPVRPYPRRKDWILDGPKSYAEGRRTESVRRPYGVSSPSAA